VDRDREHQNSDEFIEADTSESIHALPSAFQRSTKESIPYENINACAWTDVGFEVDFDADYMILEKDDDDVVEESRVSMSYRIRKIINPISECLTLSVSLLTSLNQTVPVPVAERSKAWVCGLQREVTAVTKIITEFGP